MLTRIWTGSLLLGLCASLVALVVVCMREKGVCPFRDAWSRLGRQPWGRRIAIAAFVLSLWVYASVKPGDGGGNGGGDGGGGGTNNVQMVIGPGGGLPQAGSPGAVTNTLGHGVIGEIRPMAGGVLGDPAPVVDEWSDFTPISSTNTTRTLSGDDFRRGVVMTRVGTDEEFDFAPPQNATTVSDWRGHGAATDWFYVAFTNWAFSVATNDVERLRVYSFGKIEPLVREADDSIAANYWFAPLMASLGVVPEANWDWLAESDRPIQVWYAITPQNSLVITWRNALLDRDTGRPLSFQVEFMTNGQFAYRYDFSRLDAESVSNVLAGVSFAGNEWTTNALPTNVTSMAFYPLLPEDAYDDDPDNDGVATIDELFVHYTDPRNADTDYDGLTDYEELFDYDSDPLDPNSISATYCDGFAVKLGGLDPFSCPEGSTNTVIEHIFYSGTTNGVFAYPQSSAEVAVLKVMVSGSGTGRLVVGDDVVPLVGFSTGLTRLAGLRGGANPDNPVNPVTNTLLLAVGRGVRKEVWFDKPDDLDVALDSDDFLIGEMPTWYWTHGWLAFPHTDATVPCIHDLYAKARTVTLVHGEEFAWLAATWKSEELGVAITNVPPVSAEIHGSFPKDQTRTICYTMSHPDYMAGETNYVQTLRFCPRLSEDDDDDLQGDGMSLEEEYGDGHDCSCGEGGCCGSPWCDCGCACCEVEDGETPANICAEHNCPYDQCESLHRDAYTNATAVASMAGVLKLDRVPAHTNTIPIDVPDAWVKCCDCPDHWTNCVALAAKSYNLAVRTEDGERFERTVEDCDVYVHGLAPSRDFEDSFLSLCKTGVVYETHRYTVLGLKIDHPYFNLKKLNDANPAFGFPVVIGTNRIYGADFRLRTDVDLPSGNIHIGLDGNTPGFKLYLGSPLYGLSLGGTVTDDPLLLADSSTGKSFDMSLAQWKKIMAQHTSGREMTVTLTAAQEGATDIVFGFAATNANGCVNDVVRQRVTAIKPPLKADFNHNGRIDAEDVELFRQGNPFRFWVNEEKVKLDRIPSPLPVVGGIAEWLSPEPLNTADLVVNGTYDLLNLFAVAIDLHDLTNKWGNCTVSYRIGGDSWGSSLNVTFADIPWQELELAQTNDVQTVYGGQLRSAPLTPLVDGDVVLDNVIQSFGPNSGVMLAESTGWDSDAVALKVYLDGAEAFRCRLPIRTRPVRWMYRWINSRHLSGEGETRPTNISLPDNAPYGVDSMKKLVFLHGANVSESDAELWGDQLFKRLWHAGCNVDFYNVDWRSDIGLDSNYHQDASNAFEVAAQLVMTITNIPGDKVVMAHSLGNMVVSSMIQDHGLHVSKYLMCNSAVPSEAFYHTSNTSIRVQQLVHPDWEDYPTNSWASNWHKLFANEPIDDRKYLGWPGRFANVVSNAVDFYSTGDEVLELYPRNSIGVLSGVTSSLGRYSWHKQELFKGRGMFVGGGATNWSGWNIEENPLGSNKISVEQASHMTDADFKTNTVFYCYPLSMNATNIPLVVRGAHLALGIPALAPATGRSGLLSILGSNRNRDLNIVDESDGGIGRPNGWPEHSTYPGQWLHSDIKDVSYFFNFMFYQAIKSQGGLQ